MLLVPPLVSQLLLCCNTLLSFFIPPLVDASLSFNSLIALSLSLSLPSLSLWTHTRVKWCFVWLGWTHNNSAGEEMGVPLSKKGGESFML